MVEFFPLQVSHSLQALCCWKKLVPQFQSLHWKSQESGVFLLRRWLWFCSAPGRRLQPWGWTFPGSCSLSPQGPLVAGGVQGVNGTGTGDEPGWDGEPRGCACDCTLGKSRRALEIQTSFGNPDTLQKSDTVLSVQVLGVVHRHSLLSLGAGAQQPGAGAQGL